MTRIREDSKLENGPILHEMLHQLLTRTGLAEHNLGGGLATPVGSLNTRNVDAALKDALPAKDYKRVQNK